MAKKKKKSKAVEELEEIEEIEEVEEEEDEESEPSKPKARYDVYFGLTLLTTLILIGSAALLYYDQEDLKSVSSSFNPPSVSTGALGVRTAPPKQ